MRLTALLSRTFTPILFIVANSVRTAAIGNMQDLRRAILFDVDGTLSDSYMLGFTSTNNVLKSLDIQISENVYHQGTKLTTPRRMAWHVTGNPDDPCGIELGRQFDDLYVKLVSMETAPFYDGIQDMLQAIKKEDKHVVFGALSNACGDYVTAVLRVNGVSDKFAIALGADQVPAAKPKPDGLLYICKKLNIDPAQCVYVGDSPSDGQAAEAAGMPSIGVTWGSHPEETVKPAFTRTVYSTRELSDALLQMIREPLSLSVSARVGSAPVPGVGPASN
jgi:phosphoglycolate phosphatase